MIANTLRSRVGTAKTISSLRPDRSTAVRDLHGSRKVQWTVLLPLCLLSFGWLVLQVRVLFMNSAAPSFAREGIYNQYVTRTSKTNLSEKRDLAPNATEYTSNAATKNWNRVLYTGSFGFGHRMSKLSAAVHLIVSSELRRYIPRIEVQWGTCPSNDSSDPASGVDIFAYLFHSTELFLPDIIMGNTSSEDNELDPLHSSGGKVLWIRNDVAGYYAGQAYKNAGLSLNFTRASEVFHDKLRTDYSLYEHLFLSKRFIGFYEVQTFLKQHHWEKYFVMGVHIRAGNGEQNHFTSSQRNGFVQQPEVTFSIAQSIIRLYRASMEQHRQSRPMKAPMVFLATDTEYYVQALRKELSSFCDVIVYHQQPRVPPGQGVSYETNWTNSDPQTCLQGWYGAAMDMMLLSSSDAIIATSRSTFTQIVPASIAFHRAADHTWKYCEMDLLTSSITAKMTCFSDPASWLFRRNEGTWHTFCTPNHVSFNNQSHPLCDETGSIFPVAQKLMIHFPDISKSKHDDRMYQTTIDFLRSSHSLLPNETLFYYGKKYNPKYRHSRKHETFLANWTWQ
jgi:hypothetical protein